MADNGNLDDTQMAEETSLQQQIESLKAQLLLRSNPEAYSSFLARKKRLKTQKSKDPKIEAAKSALKTAVAARKRVLKAEVEARFEERKKEVKASGIIQVLGKTEPADSDIKGWGGFYLQLKLQESGRKPGGGGAAIKAANQRARYAASSALGVPGSKVSKRAVAYAKGNPTAVDKFRRYSKMFSAIKGKPMRTFNSRAFTNFLSAGL